MARGGSLISAFCLFAARRVQGTRLVQPVTYEDLGLGQCALRGELVPVTRRSRTAEAACMESCSDDEDCIGFVWHTYKQKSQDGQCLQYLEGPLRLAAAAKYGSGHCLVKAGNVERHGDLLSALSSDYLQRNPWRPVEDEVRQPSEADVTPPARPSTPSPHSAPASSAVPKPRFMSDIFSIPPPPKLYYDDYTGPRTATRATQMAITPVRELLATAPPQHPRTGLTVNSVPIRRGEMRNIVPATRHPFSTVINSVPVMARPGHYRWVKKATPSSAPEDSLSDSASASSSTAATSARNIVPVTQHPFPTVTRPGHYRWVQKATPSSVPEDSLSDSASASSSTSATSGMAEPFQPGAGAQPARYGPYSL